MGHYQRDLVLGLAFIIALFAPGAGVAAAERAKASVECKLAEQRLVYDCTIMLTGRKSNQPIDGAKIVVWADMPSMPMAHNVKPVTAVTAGKPGMYRVRIELAMYGEWALKIDVSGPTRDRIIHKAHFGDGQSEDTSQGPAPQFYESVGLVMKVDEVKSRVTLDHEEIKGFMAAMVMSFLVTRRELLQGLEVGNKVRFTVDADKRAIVNIIRLDGETN